MKCNCWETLSPKALGGLQAPTGQSYLCPEGSRLPGFLSLKLSMGSAGSLAIPLHLFQVGCGTASRVNPDLL